MFHDSYPSFSPILDLRARRARRSSSSAGHQRPGRTPASPASSKEHRPAARTG